MGVGIKKDRAGKARPSNIPDATVFETLAIVENSHTDPVTGVARPSKESVQQAKDWVDENEK